MTCFTFFFHTKFLKSGVYLFRTDSVSQFRPASLETLPVTWLVAATLDRTSRDVKLHSQVLLLLSESGHLKILQLI